VGQAAIEACAEVGRDWHIDSSSGRWMMTSVFSKRHISWNVTPGQYLRQYCGGQIRRKSANNRNTDDDDGCAKERSA
jgi:hypothetical protein